MTKFATLNACFIEEVDESIGLDLQLEFIEHMNLLVQETEHAENEAYISASQLVLNC